MVIVGALFDGMLVTVESDLDEAENGRNDTIAWFQILFLVKKPENSSVSASDSSLKEAMCP